MGLAGLEDDADGALLRTRGSRGLAHERPEEIDDVVLPESVDTYAPSGKLRLRTSLL